MRDTIGVDHETLGDNFKNVLASSLRKASECIVIATRSPDKFVFEMVETAFLTGSNVYLVASKEDAPVKVNWLYSPIL